LWRTPVIHILGGLVTVTAKSGIKINVIIENNMIVQKVKFVK